LKLSYIFQSLKEALNLNRKQIIHIYSLQDYYIDEERLNDILKNPSKKGAKEPTYEELGIFLDGLFEYKRKEKPKINEDEEVILDNNLILKKIRAALNLKEYEIELIFELADFKISKSQIKDLFRGANHPKLKYCDDKILKAFLEGLKEFYFDSGEYL